MNITRNIELYIKNDLKEKMVFIGGPRQVGKTHLSKIFIKTSDQYLNWDDLEDRTLIKSHKINPDLKCVVLDEIHKYARWRTLIKGLYDKYKEKLSIIVTGSAKLDHFRKGGDSLFGRYHYYRLHPFTLSEVDKKFLKETTKQLLQFGGFPEPFTKQDENTWRRWQRERISRVVYQDVSDLRTVKEISMIELLVDRLPTKVGAPLSIKSLQEDLEVSPNTVSRWIEVLESVYYCYRILPYGPPKIRAVKKSNKLYLWDWSEVENQGARFENMVAGHLLKYCHMLEDTQGHRMELRYIRDTDLREIDFVVLKNKKPIFAVECKTGESHISKHLYYFRERIKIPVFYQIHLGAQDYSDGNIRVLPFEKFCQIEQIP
jgi:predicted AAA+ superfamily ATPase